MYLSNKHRQVDPSIRCFSAGKNSCVYEYSVYSTLMSNYNCSYYTQSVIEYIMMTAIATCYFCKHHRCVLSTIVTLRLLT